MGGDEKITLRWSVSGQELSKEIGGRYYQWHFCVGPSPQKNSSKTISLYFTTVIGTALMLVYPLVGLIGRECFVGVTHRRSDDCTLIVIGSESVSEYFVKHSVQNSDSAALVRLSIYTITGT